MPDSDGAVSCLLTMRDMAIESATNVIGLYRGQWPAGAVINAQLQGK
jgi:hypothetical protein